MKKWMQSKSICISVGWIVFIILLCLPSTIVTLYTYPVQDDFYNTVNVLEVMQQGHTAFGAALYKAITGYTTYSGYYFSLFLTYFTDGIVKCNLWGIRVIQFVMVVCFYIVVCIFIKCIAKEIMHFEQKVQLPICALFIMCLTCLNYFSENEDFYWFCASVIYLIPLTCILLGVILMICAINREDWKLLILVCMLGFLSGGAVLNIAAFGCILFVMTTYWGIVVKKKVKMSLLGCFPMILGGILNVVAPGNYMRKGTPITGEEIYETAIGTLKYTFERFEMYFKEFPLFPAILLILFIILLKCECKNYQYKFWVPILFSIVMVLSVAIIIFPVALGYSMEVYAIMERSNFISDLAIFTFFFFILFYFRGWLAVKLPKVKFSYNRRYVAGILIVVILFIGLLKCNIREIAAVRITRELRNGRIREYSEWNVSVIQAMEQGNDEIVEIETLNPEDKTCLINPKLYYGKYDPDKEFANRSMAKFYGKKAIYIYEREDE